MCTFYIIIATQLTCCVSNREPYKHINNLCTCFSTANVDYVTVVEDITFDSGEINQVFDVSIINDSVAEREESFEVFLKLIPGSSGVVIGEPSVANGIIFDDEILSKTFTRGFIVHPLLLFVVYVFFIFSKYTKFYYIYYSCPVSTECQ